MSYSSLIFPWMLKMVMVLGSGRIDGVHFAIGSLFPELFSLANDPSRPVASHYFDGNWNIKVPDFGPSYVSTKMEEQLQLLSRNL